MLIWKKMIALMLVLCLLPGMSGFASEAYLSEQEEVAERAKNAWEEYLAGMKPVVDIVEGSYYTVLVFDDGSVQIPGMSIDGTDSWYHFDLSGWGDITSASAVRFEGQRFLAGLRKDGTVVLEDGSGNICNWKDIQQISCGYYDYGMTNIVGLRSDGTIVGAGGVSYINDMCSQEEEWSNLKTVCVYGDDVIGVRNDGTIVQSGSNNVFSEWIDITQLSCGDSFVAGLHSDGTVSLSNIPYGWTETDQQKIDQWRDMKEIAASPGFLLALREDGRVEAAGENKYGECDVSDWNHIVSIAAGGKHSVGLREDGTVIAAGDNSCGQCNVSGWKEVVAVAAMWEGTFGLLKDGTVVSTAEDRMTEGNDGKGMLMEAPDVSEWQGISAIYACSYSDCVVGLHSDGTTVACIRGRNCWCDAATWKNIMEIDVGYIFSGDVIIPGMYEETAYLAGVQDDGRVLLLAPNLYGYGSKYLNWRDIVSVSASSFSGHLVGLKADGTVEALGNNYWGQCDVSEWKDIVSVTATDSATIGVRSDGTVVVAGKVVAGEIDAYSKEDLLAQEIEAWTDIKEIADYPIVGLRSDGTVCTASELIQYCVEHNLPDDTYDLSGWHDIVKVQAGSGYGGIYGDLYVMGIDRDGKLWYAGLPYAGCYDLLDRQE